MILAFANSLFLKLAGFLLSGLLLLTGGAPAAPAAPIEAKYPDAKLQFSVIADVHMETNSLSRFVDFAQVLTDMASAKSPQDALVLVGDNTMNGQLTEYIMLYGLLSRYDSSKNFLAAMGNHDLNQSTYATSTAIRRHNFFLQSYTGQANDKPYYSRVITGRAGGYCPPGSMCAAKVNKYTFIILGDEDPQEDTTAVISQAQLDWLAETLAAVEEGYPIFIFLHQSLNHTFAWEWGGVGAQSEAIREIIEQYENVFFFNGHLHRPFEVKQIGGVTYVNLPTLLSGAQTGIGCQVEAYEDKVVLRARDYVAGEWLEEYEVVL